MLEGLDFNLVLLMAAVAAVLVRQAQMRLAQLLVLVVVAFSPTLQVLPYKEQVVAVVVAMIVPVVLAVQVGVAREIIVPVPEHPERR
jgi:hypothetical protein